MAIVVRSVFFLMSAALILAEVKLAKPIVERTPRIAMAIKSSIRVKPLLIGLSMIDLTYGVKFGLIER